MLKLVVGGAGAGKTWWTRQQIKKLIDEGEHPVLLVPEQFSFESERAMLDLLGAADAKKAEVLSFSRLAEQIARLTGGCAGTPIDDCGRAAAMTVALSQISGQLELYRSERPSSLTEHLLDAVKEFKVCGITAQQLADTAKDEGASVALRRKLRDLSLIYAAYEATVAQAYTDPMDDLERLSAGLDESRYFEGRTVFMDSFRGFTGQELKAIERIISQAKLCVITICSEEYSSDSTADTGLFAVTNASAAKLVAIAKHHSVPVAEQEILTERPRFKNPAIAAVESSVLREEHNPYTGEHSDKVTIYSADGRYDEAEYCARECRRLIREEGYSCSDIAIIARSAERYAELVSDAMAVQGVPCFIDRRVDAADSTLMQFVIAALEVSQSWQTDTLLRWIKTGLVDGIDSNAADLIENYCFVWDIKGRAWREPFADNPEGFAPEITEEQAQQLEVINAARERAAELLGRFCERMRNSGGRGRAMAIYQLLIEAGADKRLGILCKSLPPALAEEQDRLWNTLMALLDQAALITDECTMDTAEFCSIMTMMIDRCDIGRIPQGLDEAVFGAADRIRTTAPRAVFVLGAMDGEFPAAPPGSGVFTDDERVCLRSRLGLEVAEPLERRLLEERFLVYSVLSSASERLYLTWVSDGEEEQQSECVREVLACVPNARKLSAQDTLTAELVESRAAAYELAARCWRSDPAAARRLMELVGEDEAYAPRIRAVERAADCRLPNLSSGEAAKRMIGGKMRVSPSQLEKYETCPFMYLCCYGYRLRPQRRARLDNLAAGEVTHFVLERIFMQFLADNAESIKKDKCAAFAAFASQREEVGKKVRALLAQYLDECMGGRQGKSASFLSKLRRMADGLTMMVLNTAEEFSNNDFIMDGFEVGVGEESGEVFATLPGNNTEVVITGRVDRVDTCRLPDGRKLLRVVDYKSGTKDFRLSDVCSGLSMQMLVYLDRLCSESKRYRGFDPAGVFYAKAFSGTIPVSAASVGDEDISGDRAKELKRRGIVVDDEETLEVCRAMEHDIAGVYIPAKLTAKNTLSQRESKVCHPEKFRTVQEYVRWRIMQTVRAVVNGRFEPSPMQSGQKSPCEYCDYAAVCRYEGGVRYSLKLEKGTEPTDVMTEIMQNAEKEESTDE